MNEKTGLRLWIDKIIKTVSGSKISKWLQTTLRLLTKSKAGLWFRRNNRLFFLALLALTTLVLGVLGFHRQDPCGTFLDNLYLSLQLFVLQSGAYLENFNWMLQVARFSGAIFSVLAAIQLVATLFYNQYQLLRIKVAYRKHVIICGLGGIGPILAERYLSEGKKVVIIEIKPDNKFNQPMRELGAIILIGDGADPELLRKAGIQNASFVVAVCGSDGKNAEIVSQVTKFVQAYVKSSAEDKLLVGLEQERIWCCYAHILNPHLCHFLAGQAITDYTKPHFQVEFFNIYDSGARMMLQEDAMALSFTEGPIPHMAIIGLNAVGQSLVLRSERAWRNAKRDGKLRITVIDPQADEKINLLKCSCSSLEVSTSLNILNQNIHNASFLNAWLSDALESSPKLSQVFICLDDDSEALTLGLMLLERLRTAKVPVMACLLGHGGLSDILQPPGSHIDNRAQLQVFDLLERTCKTSITEQGLFEDLAIAIHEHYREENRGRLPETDPRLNPWFGDGGRPGLADAVKISNREQALSIGVALERLGLGIEPAGSLTVPLELIEEGEDADSRRAALIRAVQQPAEGETDVQYYQRLAQLSESLERQTREIEGQTISEDDLEFTARLEHQRWLRKKLKDGWQPGEETDKAAKIHKLLYPWYYPHLNKHEKESREQTRGEVRYWPEMLAAADLRIYRR